MERKSSAAEMFGTVCDKIGELSYQNSVCEESSVLPDGTVIISVNDISLGAWAGGAHLAAKNKSSAPAGGGGKLQKKPKALLVISPDGQIKTEPLSFPAAQNKALTLINAAETLITKIKEKNK